MFGVPAVPGHRPCRTPTAGRIVPALAAARPADIPVPWSRSSGQDALKRYFNTHYQYLRYHYACSAPDCRMITAARMRAARALPGIELIAEGAPSTAGVRGVRLKSPRPPG